LYNGRGGGASNCCFILNQKIDELTAIVNKLNTQVNFTGFQCQNPNAQIVVGSNSTIIKDGQISFSNGDTKITQDSIVTNTIQATQGAVGPTGPAGPEKEIIYPNDKKRGENKKSP